MAILLVLDLVVLNKEAHKVTLREALRSSAFFIVVRACRSAAYRVVASSDALGGRSSTTPATSSSSRSSVDNLFVFALLFRYFKVPPEYQHRVLFWGIFGAIVMRALMIFAGVALVTRFEWLLHVFGAFLIYSGFKMLRPARRAGGHRRQPRDAARCGASCRSRRACTGTTCSWMHRSAEERPWRRACFSCS